MTPPEKLNIHQLNSQDAKREADANKITDAFIIEYKPVVESLAASISATKTPPGIQFDDLVSWGIEGLIKAKKKYDPTKGTQFKTYAFYRIRGEILDMIRREWAYRNPTDYRAYQERIRERVEEVMNETVETVQNEQGTEVERAKVVHDLISNSGMVYLLSLDDIERVTATTASHDPSAEILNEIDGNREYLLLMDELKGLDEMEKQVIELFYFKNLKQKEIAEMLNLSRSKVCRLHARILEKLRRRLERQFNEE